MHAEKIPGWISLVELEVIAKIAHEVNPRIVLEIGCWVGRSSIAWAESLPRSTIYCVDPWELTLNHNLDSSDQSVLDDPYDVFLANTKAFKNIVPIRSRSVDLTWRGPSVDLVFIDADHSEAALRMDLYLARQWTERRGVICGHDYDNMATKDVKPVVDGFCSFYDYDLTVYPDTYIFKARPRR